MPQGVPPLWQMSSARSVAISGALPLPRGVVPADLPPLVWPAKDPGDVLDYTLDLSAALAGDSTEQVATVAVVVTPSGNPGDLAVGQLVGNGARAVVWLSAGVPGTTYGVQITVGTLKGRVIARTVLLPVQQLAASFAPPNPLTTNTGSILTDQNGNPILVG